MTLQDVLALGALAIALLALPSARLASRATKKNDGKEGFLAHFASLRERQMALTAHALERSPQSWQGGGIPMLAQEGWVPAAPFDLEDLAVDWRERIDDQSATDARHAAARVLAPLRIAPITRYSAALVQISGMTELFDGVIYRLIDVDFGAGTKRMTFTRSSYFAYLDTCEVLSFEAAQRFAAGKPTDGRGSFRRRLGNPFDLRNRVTSLGVNTLTMRVANGRAGFFLLSRNPKQVVNNSRLLGLIPAGEFAPSDVSSEALTNDLDLWRNIMREYAEELLGMDDAQGQGGRWIDYTSASPYRELAQARANGTLRVKVLGLGIEPLTWKPELLTVCMIDASEFDTLFAHIPNRNNEGTILTGNGRDGLPFDVDTVARYCAQDDISPNAKSCLQLAWRFRSELGLA